MSAEAAASLIRRYYDAFNAGDAAAMLALVTDDVAHDVNQGDRRVGKALFQAFNERMTRHYAEQLVDVVIMASADGTRAAAEFVVDGAYLQTDGDLPPAAGQRYRLPAGAFFELRDGRIARITTYYNLPAWSRMVGG